MKEIKFHIRGPAPLPYEVTFIREKDNLTALCTCPAAVDGEYCIHRFRILEGEMEGIVEGDKAAVKIVRSWLLGSDVENAMKEVKAAQQAYYEAKKILSNAEKKLARTMKD